MSNLDNKLIEAANMILSPMESYQERLKRQRMIPQERFDTLTENLKARNVVSWLRHQDDSDGWTRDSWAGVCSDEFLDAISDLDDAAIGRMFRRRLYRDYGAESMKEPT